MKSEFLEKPCGVWSKACLDLQRFCDFHCESWLDFEGRCAPPLRSFCTSPDCFCTSPEKSCTSPWESFNDRSKWKFDIFGCLGSTLRKGPFTRAIFAAIFSFWRMWRSKLLNDVIMRFHNLGTFTTHLLLYILQREKIAAKNRPCKLALWQFFCKNWNFLM
jgi:hypothetical protein